MTHRAALSLSSLRLRVHSQTQAQPGTGAVTYACGRGAFACDATTDTHANTALSVRIAAGAAVGSEHRTILQILAGAQNGSVAGEAIAA